MKLETKLALKNYKLLEREFMLKRSFEERLQSKSRPARLLFFMVMPFLAGVAAQRLSTTRYGAHAVRIISPIGSFLLKT